MEEREVSQGCMAGGFGLFPKEDPKDPVGKTQQLSAEPTSKTEHRALSASTAIPAT